MLGTLMLAASSPALGGVVHPFAFSFDGGGTPGGSLLDPNGMAVELSSGDVYVADTGGGVLEKFSSSGGYVAQITGSGTPAGSFSSPTAVAVDNSTNPLDTSAGDVYVVDQGHSVIDKFDSTGLYVGQLTGTSEGPFSQIYGVDVDLSGDLWVYEPFSRIDEFSPAGAFIFSFPYPFSGSSPGFAVDSKGNTYAVRGCTCTEKFSPTGEDLGEVSPSKTVAVAVDHSTDDIYFDLGSEIVEYDSSGGQVGGFGSSQLSDSQHGGIAVNSSSGDVYVSNPADGRVYVFDTSFLPDVATAAVTNVQPASATLNGTVNPHGVALASCSFEYGIDSYDHSVECSGSVSSGTVPVAVSAQATGLEQGATYRFRLQATNANGISVGEEEAFTTPTPPSVEAVRAEHLGPASAELTAKIAPNASDTAYRFEYGTDASYGGSAPVPDGAVEASAGERTVTQELLGLIPDTTYHFRMIARNLAGVTVGHDHTFVYETGSGGLADGRAYEMVTPVEKAGSLIVPLPVTVAMDGSSLTGASTGAFAGLTDAELPLQGSAYYRFTNTKADWQTTPLQIFRGHMRSAGVTDSVWSPANFGGGIDSFSLRRASGALEGIGPVWPAALGLSTSQNYDVEGAASDASRGVVFKIRGQALLWPFDSSVLLGNPFSLYEYATPCGQVAACEMAHPELVGVSGGAGSTTLIGQCGVELGAPETVFSGSRYNAISEDGETMFFTVDPGEEHLPPYTASSCSDGVRTGSAPPTYELYARLGGVQTVWVSEPRCTRQAPACRNVDSDAYADPEAAKAAMVIFEGASADGSKVFFSTTQQLTDGDVDTTNDLYEYDFAAQAGKRLMLVSGGDKGDTTPGSGAEVEGVTRISEDGSHVYFVATGVLSTDPNSEGASARAGAENLYVYEPDPTNPGTFKTAFIAELCSAAETSGVVVDPNCPKTLNSSPWNFTSNHNDQALWSHGAAGGDSIRPAQSTPDGRFLLFTSYAELTADDISTTRQVFRYDAQTGTLARVSIGRQGFHDNGNAEVGDASILTPHYNNQSEAGWTRGGALARTMSDDGSYVFFQSPVGLTPQALDDIPIDGAGDLAQNVYEYHQGHISLISDGSDVSEIPSVSGNSQKSGVTLIGTSATGADVFFTTVEELVAQDSDTQVDIYDAHICSEAQPCPTSLPPSSPCQEEECQGPPSAPTSFGAPSSFVFSGGVGNLPPQPPVKKKKTIKKKVKKKKVVKKHRRHGKGEAKKPKKRGRGTSAGRRSPRGSHHSKGGRR